jgi:hypothetical protein
MRNNPTDVPVGAYFARSVGDIGVEFLELN